MANDFGDIPGDDDFEIEGFRPIEVKNIITNYVCSHCYAQLVPYYVPNDSLVIIVCSNCGVNVEKMGIVSRNTVSIRYEQGHREYRTVIKNLKDLYPTLQHTIEPKHTPLKSGETEVGRNLRELGF